MEREVEVVRALVAPGAGEATEAAAAEEATSGVVAWVELGEAAILADTSSPGWEVVLVPVERVAAARAPVAMASGAEVAMVLAMVAWKATRRVVGTEEASLATVKVAEEMGPGVAEAMAAD